MSVPEALLQRLPGVENLPTIDPDGHEFTADQCGYLVIDWNRNEARLTDDHLVPVFVVPISSASVEVRPNSPTSAEAVAGRLAEHGWMLVDSTWTLTDGIPSYPIQWERRAVRP